MKDEYYDSIQDKATDLFLKLDGVAYLIRSFNTNEVRDRDINARDGISLIIEGLSDDAKAIASMLDIKNRV